MGQLTDFTFRGKSLVGDVFVETGTYKGETARLAAVSGFKAVQTIEVAVEWHHYSSDRLGGWPGVELFCGSSPVILPVILDHKRPTTFWLDAHYQGNDRRCEMDPAYGECPLLAELAVIRKVPWRYRPVILIDDAYLFDPERKMPDTLAEGDWPTKTQIRDALPPGYDVHVHEERLYCLPNNFLETAPPLPSDWPLRAAAARLVAATAGNAASLDTLLQRYSYVCGETAAVTDFRRCIEPLKPAALELRDALVNWPITVYGWPITSA